MLLFPIHDVMAYYPVTSFLFVIIVFMVCLF
jgi:hypothetical protein